MDWEREHRTRVEANAKKVKDIYRQAAQEAVLIGATITDFNPDRPFSFDDYSNTTRRVNDLMTAMSNQIQATIVNGATVEWEQSNFKNNELARSILGFNRPSRPGQQLNLFDPPPEAATNPVLARYFNNNTDARDAFLARNTEGMNLSNRVWKYTNQFKTEIEMTLDDGIRNGHPAATMARDLRQFLVEPDRVYRRFQMFLRDPDGNFVLDREGNRIMIKQERRRYIDPQTGQITWRVEENRYKPGQGVYRSSLRNSQRLSRTENNMAYRTADHTRMQQMDFVVGQEIILSNAHLVSDICDQLQGKYPKEFFYKGWHPHCFCPVKYILKTVDELKEETEQILNQQPTTSQSVNQVTEMPDGFKRWVEDNRERVQRARTTPYFIADNFVQGDINNQMTYIPLQAQRAAQNALEVAAERARIEAAIRREAERVRMEEEARQAEAARIEAEREAERQRAEAARLAEEARLARNAANRARAAARREAARIAEAERLAEVVRLARIEAERIEAERLEAERRAAARDPELVAWIRKAERKIAEARAMNAFCPQLDALIASIAVPNPTMANIRYRIVEMNKVLKRMREEAAAAAATGAPTPTSAPSTAPATARRRSSSRQTRQAAPATGSATITASTTEAELLAILRSKHAANRAIGYEGYIMDWWEGFMHGGPIGISGNTRRDELLRGIRRMEEFETSHRTGRYTEDAKRHFKGIIPPPKPRKPGDPFIIDDDARARLKRAGWNGSDPSNTNTQKFNQLMEGFDIVEFDDEFSSLMKKYGININYKKMETSGDRYTFTITGSAKGEDFRMTRTFKRKPNGDKTVSHDYLDIPDHLQGNNLTKELFSSLYKQYNGANIVEITVHANITVGSYAWGRYGFLAHPTHSSTGHQREYLIRMVEDYKRRRYTRDIPATKNKPAVPSKPINMAEMDSIINYIRNTPTNHPVDMHHVSGMPGAYDLLYGQHWYGFIDLKNRERRQIFEDYLGKRK